MINQLFFCKIHIHFFVVYVKQYNSIQENNSYQKKKKNEVYETKFDVTQ